MVASPSPSPSPSPLFITNALPSLSSRSSSFSSEPPSACSGFHKVSLPRVLPRPATCQGAQHELRIEGELAEVPLDFLKDSLSKIGQSSAFDGRRRQAKRRGAALTFCSTLSRLITTPRMQSDHPSSTAKRDRASTSAGLLSPLGLPFPVSPPRRHLHRYGPACPRTSTRPLPCPRLSSSRPPRIRFRNLGQRRAGGAKHRSSHRSPHAALHGRLPTPARLDAPPFCRSPSRELE